jgi:hypothetical protein
MPPIKCRAALMLPTLALPALAMLVFAASPASAEELAANTGLWEMTSSMHLQGQFISPDNLAKLPPEARAQLEGAMQAMQQPQSHRTCLTAEKLRHGFRFDEGREDKCKTDVLTQTATLMEVRAVCQDGDSSSTMHAHISVTGRDHMTGSFEVERAGAEGPQHMSGQIEGKWLSADCAGADKDGQ